ncbi:1-phosphatidylinositol phosphodiesterase [Ceratocystis fimbriata CBS 114723]|uniref:1-phosphatidylinositol phosphodiesterase n=1 Tax=Ceratocystis fimbriata CBS 114723 TaxID=1035309 RepID=A0A2C5WVQ5_9PEZI|nr:1-phosphatidylinositol phosphodiesterase [Ceratocystis fimbriata CBS 114723]
MRFSLLTTLPFLALSYAGVFGDINDFWSFDVDVSELGSWMDTIADDTPLSSLSLPGTHNSMAYDLGGKPTQTQNVSLEKQLAGGIRYIDITCRYSRPSIWVYHGSDETGYSLEDVWKTMFDFLEQNPREAIVLRIQRGGTFSRSKAFAKAFNKQFYSSVSFAQRCFKFIYSEGVDGISTIPTLGKLRGKIFILQDFETDPVGRHGLPWSSHTVSNYHRKFSLGTMFSDMKWDGIKAHFSESPPQDSDKLRITYTTGSSSASPVSIAGQNYPGVGMNKLVGEYLSNEEGDCFGILAMDFPGKFLVEKIVELNNKYRVTESPSLAFDNSDADEAGYAGRGA